MRAISIFLLCLMLLCSGAFAEEYEVYYVGGEVSFDLETDAKQPRCGVCDEKGREIIPPLYEDILVGGDGTSFSAQQGGLWGYLDLNGKWLIEPKYEIAFPFDYGYAVVGEGDLDAARSDGFFGDEGLALYGVIDTDGREVLPIKYKSIKLYSDGCFEADGQICTLGEDGPVQVSSVENYIYEFDYHPFESDKLAVLDEKSTLKARGDKKHRQPCLDGDVDLLPLYAAVVQAVYPKKTRYEDTFETDTPVITCTGAEESAERLASGAADMIFLSAADAAALGEGYECVPIARDALVFAVNQANPADGLSTGELRSIFSGKTAVWPDGEPIVAYQCPEDSAGQEMLKRLMDGTALMTPPRDGNEEFCIDGGPNISYRNLENAVGCALLFSCGDAEAKGIKLLAVDGVAPTGEAVRGGTYPYTVEYVAVTRAGEKNGNVAQLLDWILSPQGQALIEKAGYVAVK